MDIERYLRQQQTINFLKETIPCYSTLATSTAARFPLAESSVTMAKLQLTQSRTASLREAGPVSGASPWCERAADVGPTVTEQAGPTGMATLQLYITR